MIAAQEVKSQVGHGALRDDESSSLKTVSHCFSSAVFLDHLKSLCPLTLPESVTDIHQQSVTCLISFDYVGFLKTWLPNTMSLMEKQRHVCSGASMVFKDQKDMLSKNFPSYPLPSLFIPDLPGQTQLIVDSLYCVRWTWGNSEMRNFFVVVVVTKAEVHFRFRLRFFGAHLPTWE